MENSNAFAIFLALIVILWTFISMKVHDIDSSPALLHNVAWAGALLIIGSGLLRYTPTSGYAWLLIAASIFCFNSGVTFAGMRPKQPSVASDPIIAVKPLVTRRAYRTLIFLFSVGFALYLVTIAKTFGIATLINDPGSIRSYSHVSYMEVFPLYGKILFYLGPLCLILTIFPEFVQGLRERPLAWRITIMAYLATAQVATLQRTNLFISIVWAIGLLLLRKQQQGSQWTLRKLTSKQIVSLVLAAVIGFITFQGLAIVLGKAGTNNPVINSVVDPRLQNSQALSVMYYASSGIVAFGKLTESQNEEWPPPSSGGPLYGDYSPMTWGAATFAGPLKLVPGIDHWNEIAPFISVPVPTNVYTWLEGWYRDFRWAGVLFGSLITGLIIGRFATRSHLSPETMLAASLLVGLTALATFVNRYMSVMSVVIYVTLWYLGVVRRSRETADQKRGVDYSSKTRSAI